jgi:hypothetical protein
MIDTNDDAFEGVDPVLAVKTIGLIGLNCARKSKDENLSNEDKVKYLMVTMKAQEFLGSIISLGN